jgi:hypothetical protein
MRSITLPRWPILILLAAFFFGPTAAPVSAAPLPVPMAAAETAPAAAVETVQYYGYRRHYGYRPYGFRRHYGYRRHFGYRPYGYRRHFGHRPYGYRRGPAFFY